MIIYKTKPPYFTPSLRNNVVITFEAPFEPVSASFSKRGLVLHEFCVNYPLAYDSVICVYVKIAPYIYDYSSCFIYSPTLCIAKLYFTMLLDVEKWF